MQFAENITVENMTIIDVAVGIISKNTAADDKEFFVCRRAVHQHQGNKWEFPGGKVDKGEKPEDALARELFEEVGIAIDNISSCAFVISHKYEDKHVNLHVFNVQEFDGDPFGKEGQQSQWVKLDTLLTLNFPKANKPILDYLRQQA
ncbi:8-oxo-dGTP diphosphatase MutT [Agaribacter flavus]|uniref:8-oxo-dGTP diphosphatase n=1 Tax=Agaribacter flavus TaxID=1902781 RepID=A0ABV7FKT0_9ALTE